jgi:hypothetical protein
MHSVVIVGAGGSLAQAGSYRPRRTLRHPPLDGNFFDKAADLATRDAGVRQAVRAFRAVLAPQDAILDPMAPPRLQTLEQYFADVYYEVASHRSELAFEVFKRLLRLYMRVLAATTNWMTIRPDEAVLGRVIRREIQRARPDRPTVITFNQDLVLENVVARIPRLGNRWCLQGLYTAQLQVVSRNPRVAFPVHAARCPHDAPIELLKLHGSLNWFLQTSESDPRLGTLFPTDPNKQVYVNDDRVAAGTVTRVNYGAGPGRRRWYLWPLVVPPIYDKQRVTGIGLLQGLWTRAEEAIRNAERLTLIGYSLPDADVLARQSLRRSYIANANLVTVDCINPDVRIAEKLKNTLDCRVVRLFHDVESYLGHGF